jgi:hypothetical protein
MFLLRFFEAININFRLVEGYGDHSFKQLYFSKIENELNSHVQSLLEPGIGEKIWGNGPTSRDADLNA